MATKATKRQNVKPTRKKYREEREDNKSITKNVNREEKDNSEYLNEKDWIRFIKSYMKYHNIDDASTIDINDAAPMYLSLMRDNVLDHYIAVNNKLPEFIVIRDRFNRGPTGNYKFDYETYTKYHTLDKELDKLFKHIDKARKS